MEEKTPKDTPDSDELDQNNETPVEPQEEPISEPAEKVPVILDSKESGDVKEVIPIDPFVDTDHVKLRVIEEEMKQSYLDYAMSVIVGRALPDVRDGLKPVHRRILYAMHQMGMTHNKPFKKSARIVGETLGKYHPHGDTAVYDTMVRMAQYFALRYRLIDGQGNFGSVDGDRAAAMRYTEARMTKVAESMLADIEKGTVDFQPNFDESLKEPIVLPSKFPCLLANGSTGIAVGMATNIPPHNINELCSAIVHIIDNPEAELSDLMEFVKGPDFPTGGIIYGRMGILQAYKTGRGRVVVRGKTHIEETPKRQKIIIDEIPYQVNKASMIEQIAGCVHAKIIPGISDIRDESDKDGMRVVIELKRDAAPQIVLNQLFKHSRLQQTFGVITLALIKGVPRVLSLREVLDAHIEHRIEVVTRRTQFELDKAIKQAHILVGLKKAIDDLDRAIKIIRGAESAGVAREGLISAFELDVIQAQAILDMKLQRLTGLERDKIVKDYQDLLRLMEDLKDILANKVRIMDIIKTETQEIIDSYKDDRKSEIVDVEDEIDIEDLIEDEDVVITISRGGYCKRVSVDTYKAQRRGGRGIRGASTKEDDIVEDMFVTHSKAYILCFTNLGRVYWIKTYHVPESSRTATGKHVANLLPLMEGERVNAFVPVAEFHEGFNLMLATKNGTIKKSSLIDYSRPRKGGIRGIVLDDGDQLINAVLTDGDQKIIIATKKGMAVRFNESDARTMGRVSRGVRGIRLKEGDEVIGMVIAHNDKTLLTVTEKGYGKRTPILDYRLINRGGKGVINIQTTDRNGGVVAVKEVDDEQGLMLMSKKGIIIRTRADQISVISRNTQGVRLMKLDEGDSVVGVSKITQEEEEEILNSDDDSELVVVTEPAEDVAKQTEDSTPVQNQEPVVAQAETAAPASVVENVSPLPEPAAVVQPENVALSPVTESTEPEAPDAEEPVRNPVTEDNN
jgi:DNA gyrase subunit A